MTHNEEISQFINRCKNELKKIIEDQYIDFVKPGVDKKNISNKNWRKKNPEKYKECLKNYSKTDKGKYANAKRNLKRKNNEKKACEGLTYEEKILIGRFYKNCPNGYEVDHIIPISRGGKHILSNLQYLTKEENKRKSYKTWDEYQKSKDESND